MYPLSQPILLGDFCQIQRSRLKPLGNLSQLNLADVYLSATLPMNEDDWKLSAGVNQIYYSTEQTINDQDQSLEWNKQILGFADIGSFVFHGTNPQCEFMLNWSELVENITVTLTQGSFSFRELYVVTAIAMLDSWGLAIAGKDEARLEMSSEISEADCYTLMSNPACRATESKYISSYSKSSGYPAYFFKAKKLVLTDRMRETFLSELLQQSEQLAEAQVANWIDAKLINKLKSNELNMVTALEFFTWVDVSLDDVELLC